VTKLGEKQMNIRQIKSTNAYEVTVGNNLVLMSYETPVAARVDGNWYRTEKHYSVTTSKHLNQWFRFWNAPSWTEQPPSFFENLVEVSKDVKAAY
jgi:hypothetical protein